MMKCWTIIWENKLDRRFTYLSRRTWSQSCDPKVYVILLQHCYAKCYIVNFLYTCPRYLYDDWIVRCTSWLTLVILKYCSDFIFHVNFLSASKIIFATILNFIKSYFQKWNFHFSSPESPLLHKTTFKHAWSMLSTTMVQSWNVLWELSPVLKDQMLTFNQDNAGFNSSR